MLKVVEDEISKIIEWDVEQLCRTHSLEAAFLSSDHPAYNKKLFINVNPNIMHDIKFRQGFTKEYLSQFGITPDNIIHRAYRWR